MTDARLMSSTDAAHYLGVSRPKLYELDVRFVMMGRNRRYDRRDLDAFIDLLHSQQVRTAPKRRTA